MKTGEAWVPRLRSAVFNVYMYIYCTLTGEIIACGQSRGRPGLIFTDECRQAKWNRRTPKSTSPAATIIRRKYRRRRLFHFPLSSSARRLLLCKVGDAAAAAGPTDLLDIKLDPIAKADL